MVAAVISVTAADAAAATDQAKSTSDVLTVTAPSTSMAYGGTVPDVSNPTYDGPTPTTDATCTTTATSSSPVGDYPITCSGAVSDDNAIVYQDGVLSVEKAPLTVTAPSPTKVYGATNPALPPDYDGFVNGDDADDLSTTPTCTTSADEHSPVGDDDVSCSGGASDNYSFDYVDGTISITPRALTVTGPTTSRAYGDANPTLVPTYDGFANTDDADDLTTSPTCTSAATTTSGLGSYPVTCSGATAVNYSVTYAAGSLNVTKRPLTVTPKDSFATYGSAAPSVTPNYDGFAPGEDASVLTTKPTCTATTTTTTPAGTYTGASNCTGGTATNYIVSYTTGTVTIGKKSLVVVAPDHSRQYGNANPTITPNYSGFINGDDQTDLGTVPTCSTAAVPTSSVGSYAITCSGGAATNYRFGYVDGTLTVTKAPLSIRAGQTTKLWGIAGPAPSPTYTGFKNNETRLDLTKAPACSTTLKTGTPVGSVARANTCKGAVSSNYAITYVAGTGKVLRARINVAGTPITVVRSAKNKLITFSARVMINQTGRPVSGLALVFTLGSPGHRVTCRGFTNAHGVATCKKKLGDTAIGSPKTYRITGPATRNYVVLASAGAVTLKP